MYSYTTPPQSKLADLLGGNVSRLLGDKSYDKRKAAGQEIEGAVRAALEQMTAAQEQLKDLKMRQAQLGEKHPDHQPLEDQILQVWRVVSTQERCIRDIISALHEDFLLHALPNHRKGGLIAFASVAIALERSELERFLPQLIPPLLSAFSDPEPRVRYYACEALYNLLKVSWDLSLKFLNDIFDGVCKLYGDVDHDVRAGILFVDRLLKEIFVSAVNWGGKESFLLLLVKRCRVKNPFIKLLALSWIALLDSVPDIDMLQYLHLFIESLFEMLADSNRDIRHAADACVASLLEEVREGAHDRSDVRDLAAVVQVVLKSLRNPDSFCRLTALVWLQQLLSLALQPVAAPPSPTSSHGGELREEAEKVNTPGDGETKHEHQAELERRVQQQYEKRRQWQMDMQKQLQPLFAHIVDGVLQCAADREEEIRRMALQNHQHLLFQVLATGPELDIRAIVNVLKGHLVSHDDADRALSSSRHSPPVRPSSAPDVPPGRSSVAVANPKTVRLVSNSLEGAAREVRLLCLQWLQLFLLERREEILKEPDLQEELLCAALLALRHHNVVGHHSARGASASSSSSSNPLLHIHSEGSERAAAVSSATEATKGDNIGMSSDHPHRACLSEISGDPQYPGIVGLHQDASGSFRRQFMTNQRGTGKNQSSSTQAHNGLLGSSSTASAFLVSSTTGLPEVKAGRRHLRAGGYDVVTETALRVLAMLADQGRPVFEALVDRLLDVFQHDRRMMESRGRLIIGRLCTFLDAQMLFELVALSVKKRSSLACENSDCCPSVSSTKLTIVAGPSNYAKKESKTKSKRRSVSLPPSSASVPDRESEDVDASGCGRQAPSLSTARRRLDISQQNIHENSLVSSSGSILENESTSEKKHVRGDSSPTSQETDEKEERQRREQRRSTLVASADELLFIHQTIQVFNWVLLSAQETEELREKMVRDKSAVLFRRLLPAWIHNPVATLALALRIGHHRLAVALVRRLAQVGNLSLQVYVQLDQLILLFESPAFVPVRLLLLRPHEYPHLVEALMGISLLMPQNSSYQFLHKRLSLLPSVCGIIYGSPPMAMGGMASVERKSLSTEQVISQELEKEVCYWFDMLYSVYGASITAEQAEASMAASSMLELCTPEWTPPLSSCHLTGDSSEKHNGLIQGTCELQPTVSPAESRVEGRSHLQEKTESDCNSESGEVGSTIEGACSLALKGSECLPPSPITLKSRKVTTTTRSADRVPGSVVDGSLHAHPPAVEQGQMFSVSNGDAVATGLPSADSANTEKSVVFSGVPPLGAACIDTGTPMRSQSRAAYEDLSEILRTVGEGTKNGDPQRQLIEDPDT